MIAVISVAYIDNIPAYYLLIPGPVTTHCTERRADN